MHVAAYTLMLKLRLHLLSHHRDSFTSLQDDGDCAHLQLCDMRCANA